VLIQYPCESKLALARPAPKLCGCYLRNPALFFHCFLSIVAAALVIAVLSRWCAIIPIPVWRLIRLLKPRSLCRSNFQKIDAPWIVHAQPVRLIGGSDQITRRTAHSLGPVASQLRPGLRASI